MLCFLAFTAAYYLTAGAVLVYKEQKLKDRYRNEDKTKAKAMDRAVSVTNFANAVISTSLSSVALYSLSYEQKATISLRRPNSVAQWTIESVCGYIFVELTFILADSYRLSDKYWKLAKGALMSSMIFHAVALVGLSSVLIFNTGYSIALWVIWTELTSVFLGVEDWMEEAILKMRFPLLFDILKLCTSVMFVFQRVFLFLVLLWLCGQQFTWQPLFLLQLLILCVGTVLNVVFAAERVFSWNTWYILSQ